MKNKLSLRAGVFALFVTFASSAYAGPYYVVIGSFSTESAAREFAGSAMKIFEGVSLKSDERRKLHYVHVLETSQYQEAEELCRRLRDRDGLANAWVYRDFQSEQPSSDERIDTSGDLVKLELYTGAAVLLSSTDNQYMSISKDREDVRRSSEQKGLAFNFLATSTSGAPVQATVSLLDRQGAVISVFKSGETIAFSGNQQRQTLTLISETPGYYPELMIIRPDRLASMPGIQRDENGVYTISFTMAYMKVDDVSLRYRDLFHSGTAILKAEAKEQLRVLITWLKADKSWRMVMNSHSTPVKKCDIRVPGRSGDPFDLDNAAVRAGSDKHLTRFRAEVLRDYLAAEDIDPKRITIMGWGSMDPVVSPSSERAALNERVEVELAKR